MYSSKQRRGKGGEEKLHAPKKQKKRGGIPAGSDFLNNKTQVSRLFLHRATYGNGLKFVLIFPGMWKKFFSIFFSRTREKFMPPSVPVPHETTACQIKSLD